MVALLDHLALGFSVAFSLQNVLFCFIGALLGTLVGVLPGLGPAATISMLLPITFGLDPVSSIIMLAGVYYGAQYGGSTTAILVNLPGESSSVVTALDGYQMARKGEAGAALAIAAIGSFFAGTVGTLIVAAVAIPIGKFALSFGAPEYFSLIVLGLIVAIVLSSGSFAKSLAMTLFGVTFALAGTDLFSGIARFTFGFPELSAGLQFRARRDGALRRGRDPAQPREPAARPAHPRGEGDRPLDFVAHARIGVPRHPARDGGGHAARAAAGQRQHAFAFTAYALEKKVSKHPERFGTGCIEGVAAPESANNASAQLGFVPLLTLGIPSGATTAIMLGILAMQGVTIGPLTMTKSPELFWGLIASMWIGNLMLVIINLPIGIWVQMLKIPYRFLFPAILVFSAIGSYSLRLDVRHLRADLLRGLRLRDDEARLSADQFHAGLRARRAAGAVLPPLDAARPRRPLDLREPQAEPVHAAACPRAGDHARAAGARSKRKSVFAEEEA